MLYFLGINEALRVSEFVKTEFGSTKKLRFIETTTSGLVTGLIVGSFWCKFLRIFKRRNVKFCRKHLQCCPEYRA